MEKVLKKLGYKEGMESMIINAPEIPGNEIIKLLEPVPSESFSGRIDFIMFFAETLKVLRDNKDILMGNLNPEGRLWIIYPKKTSKKYKSDLSRDILWGEFGEFGYEPVSQFSVDEDWSAVRYRHVSEIKTMKRKVFASEEGKKRAGKEI